MDLWKSMVQPSIYNRVEYSRLFRALSRWIFIFQNRVPTAYLVFCSRAWLPLLWKIFSSYWASHLLPTHLWEPSTASLCPPVRQCQTAITSSCCLVPAEQIPPSQALMHLVCLPWPLPWPFLGLLHYINVCLFLNPVFQIQSALTEGKPSLSLALSVNFLRVHSDVLPMSMTKIWNSICIYLFNLESCTNSTAMHKHYI